MSAKKKRSKKRSDANLTQPHNGYTFFIERTLGSKVVPTYLREQGLSIQVHSDFFPSDSPDRDWIWKVGNENLLAVTEDRGIRYRRNELEDIRQANARVFVLRAKDTTGPENARIIYKARNRMALFANRTKPPFIVAIYRSGHLKAYNSF